jgi:5-methylcytosine-specific restriction endonuclease McrA
VTCLAVLAVLLGVIGLLGMIFGESSSPVELRSDGYTKDWSNVSTKKKKSKSWICQECKVNCSGERNLVHTHHRNGDRKDNSEGNLVVLCIQCHGEKPGAGHKRLKTRAQNDGRWARVSKLRKEQNGSWW